MAVELSGAQMPAFANPSTALGSRKSQMGVSGCISEAFQNSATDIRTRPAAVMNFGLTRSMILPTTGARPPEITAIGTIISADCVGVRPRTTW